MKKEQELEKKIRYLVSCLIDKDKRITKLEERLNTRKKILLSIVAFLFLSPFVVMVFYMRPMPDNIPIELVVYSAIGMMCITAVSILLWFCSLNKIWAGRWNWWYT